MSLIRKHGAVLQAWACLDLVNVAFRNSFFSDMMKAVKRGYQPTCCQSIRCDWFSLS